jgi:hypothetical protein
MFSFVNGPDIELKQVRLVRCVGFEVLVTVTKKNTILLKLPPASVASGLDYSSTLKF